MDGTDNKNKDITVGEFLFGPPPAAPETSVTPPAPWETFLVSAGKEILSVFSWIFDALYKLWNKNSAASWGMALGLITWITYEIVSHFGGSSSSSITAKPASPLTATQAAAQRQDLQNTLQNMGVLLETAGVPRNIVQTHTRIAYLSQGTSIALAVKNDPSSPDVSIASGNRQVIRVISANAPSHYAGILSLDANSYLDTLSSKPTARKILANSAIIHDAKVIER